MAHRRCTTGRHVMPGSITQNEDVQDARRGGAQPHESRQVIFPLRANVSTGPGGGVSGTIEHGIPDHGELLHLAPCSP